jgi:nucleoside-diphosphate-sugar epimerase
LKNALVCGAGGFIGHHLVCRLKAEGYWVRGIDLKYPEFEATKADEFVIGDLSRYSTAESAICPPSGAGVFDEIYQLAADMGGAGYIFSGENDASVMQNSASINLSVLDRVLARNRALGRNETRIFYSSSACIYPARNQLDPDNPICREDTAYPASPDSEYGWEKLFSERLYLSYQRNFGLQVFIARFHNIFGPMGTWRGGREKSPAAICRKVAQADPDGTIEIWGDGEQTRSFLYVDECIDGVRRLVSGDFCGPVNIGSEEMTTINNMVDIVSAIAGKRLTKVHVDGPLGVRGRNSDNSLIREKLGWAPDYPMKRGLEHTYHWIRQQIENGSEAKRSAP